MDPLAEKKVDHSGYIYGKNNLLLFIDPDGLDDIYYDNRGNEVQRIKNEAPDRFYLANRTDRGSLEVVTQLEQAPINESPTLTSLGLASAMVIPLGGSSMSANAAIASYLEASLSIAAPTVIVVSALAIIASENKKYNLPCISGTAMEPCSPWDYDPLMDNGRLYAETEPQLPDKTIIKEGQVEIKHYTRSGDHAPPHVHVKGGGSEVKIGQNGKPLKGSPELSVTQREVVENNKQVIRRAVKKIGRWHRHQNPK